TSVLLRDLTLSHVGPTLDYVMGFVSGVANASIGTNGPPLVFDLQSRRLSPNEFRGTIATVFVLGNLFTITLFLIDGKLDADGLRAAGVAFPAWLAGAILGRALQPKVPEHLFRNLVLGLLLVTGVATIATAL
ncbi:MAG: TSUP family transporter, partial [Acidimicrobiia bacterium]